MECFSCRESFEIETAYVSRCEQIVCATCLKAEQEALNLEPYAYWTCSLCKYTYTTLKPNLFEHYKPIYPNHAELVAE